MSVPLWRRSLAPTQEVDVLVVGAGIAGVSAGIELRARGLRVGVVERARLGDGASTRNAGFLMRGMAENYALAVDRHGRALAREMWRWTEQNLEILLSRGVGSLPSFRRTPSCLLALEAGELGELRRSLTLLHEDGFDAAWLDRHDDNAWDRSGALGGLVNPGDASVNPAEMLAHLARPLSDLLHEGEALLAMGSAPGGGGAGVVVASTTARRFHARRVLLCTNAYTGRVLAGLDAPASAPASPAPLPPIRPVRGQMLAIRPDRPYRLDHCYYASHGSEYFRQTPDALVVLGGKRKSRESDEVGFDDHPTDHIQRELERYARDVLALTGTVVARWAGTMGFTPDALPRIAPLAIPNCPESSVWLCAGFTGHGMSLAARAARAAVAAMVDGEATPLPALGAG